jgi:hypothetical protein
VAAEAVVGDEEREGLETGLRDAAVKVTAAASVAFEADAARTVAVSRWTAATTCMISSRD